MVDLSRRGALGVGLAAMAAGFAGGAGAAAPFFKRTGLPIGLQLYTLGGDLRADVHPFLMAFYLVRMELEILDLVPTIAMPMAGLSADGVLPLAERTWFELFWRGVAARPEQPLPPLAPVPETP